MASLINKNTKKILELKRKLEELKDNCGENSFEYIKFFNDNFDLILNLPIEQIYYYSRENHSNFTKENIEKLKNKLLSIKISSVLFHMPTESIKVPSISNIITFLFSNIFYSSIFLYFSTSL